MYDIACGIKDAGLVEFAKSVSASCMSDWRDLGLYDEDVEGWGQAFEQVITRTLAAGGLIYFSLDQMNIAEALAGDPNEFVGRYTAYELLQIVTNPAWFAATRFYLSRAQLTDAEVNALGIRCSS
jgi:hypothetical protein